VNNQPSFIIFLIVLIVLCLPMFFQFKLILKWFTNSKKSSKAPAPRALKPRSEKNCPQCRKARESGEVARFACSHTPMPRQAERRRRSGCDKTLNRQEGLHNGIHPRWATFDFRSQSMKKGFEVRVLMLTFAVCQ